jgi:hypothetical protein
VRGDKKESLSSDLVMDLYSSLLVEVWAIVSELIGGAILALLFSVAIRNLGDKYSFLKSMEVTEDGLSMRQVREVCRRIPPAEVHRGFQSLITHLLDLSSALAEGVVSREILPKVFPKVREADRIISQK